MKFLRRLFRWFCPYDHEVHLDIADYIKHIEPHNTPFLNSRPKKRRSRKKK